MEIVYAELGANEENGDRRVSLPLTSASLGTFILQVSRSIHLLI